MDNGEYTQNTKQAIKQWASWIKQNFQKTKPEAKPTTQHITEETWEEIQKQIHQKSAPPDIDTDHSQYEIPEDIQLIRAHSQLNHTIKKHPQIKRMLTKTYEEKEIHQAIRQLKNNKSHGADGIPGEAYKTLIDWVTPGITEIMTKIQQGDKAPPEWKLGTVVHIYKNKGDIHECKNYRPICLTQIAYKIWPILITRRLAKILHALANINQYGYKQGLSTLDAIQKIEQYLRDGGGGTHKSY